jgi:hypothetical protein
MVMGVCCKLMNTLYWKDMITLYFVYIPEIIFINSIFGYLVILILIKWTTNWDTMFVLNNYENVRIPQIYCKDDLSNVPCWTAPFQADRSLVPGYGASKLAALPEHQWCMTPTATAGCAVFEYKGRLIVEANTYGNMTYTNPEHYNPGACEASDEGCMLWKQGPPSLLDTLIKMFMEPGSVPIENQLIGGQGPLQALLILIAFVSVPMLLFPKPFLLKREHEAKMAGRSFQPLQNVAHEEEEAGGKFHPLPPCPTPKPTSLLPRMSCVCVVQCMRMCKFCGCVGGCKQDVTKMCLCWRQAVVTVMGMGRSSSSGR